MLLLIAAFDGVRMKSLSASYLSALQFTSEQVATLRTIGECRRRQDLFTRQTPAILEALRQAAIVESSECSNRLEGITAPHHRIEALVIKSSAPRNRSEQGIAGYRDALAWFSVWEEVTEMLFIAAAALVLWLFRHGLFAAEANSG